MIGVGVDMMHIIADPCRIADVVLAYFTTESTIDRLVEVDRILTYIQAVTVRRKQAIGAGPLRKKDWLVCERATADIFSFRRHLVFYDLRLL